HSSLAQWLAVRAPSRSGQPGRIGFHFREAAPRVSRLLIEPKTTEGERSIEERFAKARIQLERLFGGRPCGAKIVRVIAKVGTLQKSRGKIAEASGVGRLPARRGRQRGDGAIHVADHQRGSAANGISLSRIAACRKPLGAQRGQSHGRRNVSSWSAGAGRAAGPRGRRREFESTSQPPVDRSLTLVRKRCDEALQSRARCPGLATREA